jgi:hypothetical protein
MPRRHAWMQDYNYEQGCSLDRSIPGSSNYNQENNSNNKQQPPVNINININLGDLISQLISGKKTTKEALEEVVKNSKSNKEQLNE